ncbi:MULTISPECIES: hypothetical protein [Pseudomonas]|jgi:hypothetical protein|uniref:Uncharacterized protein n=1 Tax=Pseudomonas flexibilis TaxID=706570 RepID=A0A0B2DD53_9PSED|nr:MULTISPECIES: hypothetical protein [Pseudomonas]KHL70962.1 hypothetical protein SF06_03720 [Pseudomonas flexibilis]KHO65279.1 hypothetical protein PT85_04090 [Pseudomonas flexibilis]SCX87020.1 hypothetical protein SAMN02927929_00763 [Pseudomonas flexibilis]SIP90315.1 hypothetical protein SAMN05421672_101248 [Pseudomonas flexibilis]HTO18219.1 hypothetical protein [Pseudomonas sp.]
MIFVLLSVLVGGLCLAVLRTPDADLRQAALQPFADDPPAARQLEQETGLRCERVVEVPFEDPRPFHLEA